MFISFADEVKGGRILPKKVINWFGKGKAMLFVLLSLLFYTAVFRFRIEITTLFAGVRKARFSTVLQTGIERVDKPFANYLTFFYR